MEFIDYRFLKGKPPPWTMDNAIFRRYTSQLRSVSTGDSENTSCLEMWSYSNPDHNWVSERPLSDLNFELFVNRWGVPRPPALQDNVHLVGGIRLIIQNEIRNPEGFKPSCVSMMADQYLNMIKGLRLPRIAIECSSVVGPFFWYDMAYDEDGSNPRLQMIFRNSDQRELSDGGAWGWEFILSHDLNTAITTGYCRKSPRSLPNTDWLGDLKNCVSEVGHAMLLPMILMGLLSSDNGDKHHREARTKLRDIEDAVIRGAPKYTLADGVTINIAAVATELAQCQSRILWNQPAAHLEVIVSIREAGRTFRDSLSDEARKRGGPMVERFDRTMKARLLFYEKRWKGIESYGNVTKHRLDVQRNALYNLIAQKDSKLNLQMAIDQKLLAHKSKRESEAMRGISLLGTIFLPGAFLASIFSTSFFNFWDTPDIASVASPKFWFFLAVAIPFTVLIVCLYFLWDLRRTRRYDMEDIRTQTLLGDLEANILKSMRPRGEASRSGLEPARVPALPVAALQDYPPFVGSGGTA